MKQQPAIWIDNYKSTTKTIKTSTTWNSVKANKKSKAQNKTKLWKKGQSSPIVQMKWGKLLSRTPHTMYRGPKNSNGQSLPDKGHCPTLIAVPLLSQPGSHFLQDMHTLSVNSSVTGAYKRREICTPVIARLSVLSLLGSCCGLQHGLDRAMGIGLGVSINNTAIDQRLSLRAPKSSHSQVTD